MPGASAKSQEFGQKRARPGPFDQRAKGEPNTIGSNLILFPANLDPPKSWLRIINRQELPPRR
jgi:hypothetical protein